MTRILIANGDWWLGERLESRLQSAGHETQVLPRDADLGHDSATDDAVAGVDSIVVFGYPDESGDATFLLDRGARRLYNLLHAASEAGVSRCIYVSTLLLFRDYEENLTVTEKWRSLPPSEDPALLACHLGEIVCKEYARDRRIQVATVRLGFPIVDGDRAAAQAAGESAAVSSEDAVEAVRLALESDALAPWQDIHVQSPVERQRYLMHAASKLLGYPS